MKKQITVVECDLCGKDDAMPVVIAIGDSDPFRVDLCPKHSGPVESLREHGAPSGRPRRKGSKRVTNPARATKKEGRTAPQI